MTLDHTILSQDGWENSVHVWVYCDLISNHTNHCTTLTWMTFPWPGCDSCHSENVCDKWFFQIYYDHQSLRCYYLHPCVHLDTENKEASTYEFGGCKHSVHNIDKILFQNSLLKIVVLPTILRVHKINKFQYKNNPIISL